MTGYPRFFIPIIFSRRQNSIRHDVSELIKVTVDDRSSTHESMSACSYSQLNLPIKPGGVFWDRVGNGRCGYEAVFVVRREGGEASM